LRSGAYLRSMLRESRGARGRLVFFTACLALGVAAVVGVASLIAAIEGAIRSQSRELLAADLAVESRRELPPELDAFFAGVPGVERTDVLELATMASLAPATDRPEREAGRAGAERSRLCELKVVDGRFPLYGELLLEPPGSLAERLDERTTVVAPELLDGLGLAPGDDLWIGGQPFRIAAAVEREPDRLDFSLALGPRVFLSAAGLARTELVGFGSRVRHRALFALPGDPSRAELAALGDALRSQLPGAAYLRVENHHEAQPTLRRALGRVERFLGLVALVSLVLGGIGVAQIVRIWIAGRTRSVAVQRCLGMRPREVLALYLGHVVVLALAASAAGCALGAALPGLVTLAAPDLLPAGAGTAVHPSALARGFALGVSIAVLFTLPELTAVWRVPPARVLRAEAEPLPAPRRVRAAALAALALGVFGSAWVQGGEAELAAWFTAGMAAVALALAGAARLAMVLASRLPRERLNPYLRHGLAALARPSAGTVGAIVALGLGVMVIVAMALVERRLASELRTALPASAPSAFLVDVQPSQWEGVEALLVEHGASHVDAVPVVMARLASIDGQGVDALVRERAARGADGTGEDGRRRARWVLTREQRLTWLDALPASNTLVEGALWSADGVDEVSLEVEYARDLGVGPGSVLEFDVQGVPVELRVTSLREVEWQSFAINFFLVVEPGVLDTAPRTVLAAARLEEPDEERLQDDLAAACPNVTLMRVRPVLERLLALMERLALGVRALGALSVATGVVILAGAVASTALKRTREVALLKALGVTRRGVVALFATEYALSGLIAGLLGGAGAFALAGGFLTQAVELDAELPWSALPLAGLATAAAAALCGLGASRRALAAPPLDSLRA